MSLRAFHILRLRLPHRRLLTKLMYVVRMHSNSGSMQALSHSTFAVVVTHSVHFHADVRASLAHLAIVILQQHGTSFTKPQVEEFASKSEALLLGAGQYLLQSNLMCLLEAYSQSSPSASRVMASLESRFCKLEPDISCSPAPGVPARPSPRKLLNAYNVFHQGASSVISVLPLEQRLFGHRPNQVRPLRGGSHRVLCPSLASLPPAPSRRPALAQPRLACLPSSPNFGASTQLSSAAWVDFNLATRDFAYEAGPHSRTDLLFEDDLRAVQVEPDDGAAFSRRSTHQEVRASFDQAAGSFRPSHSFPHALSLQAYEPAACVLEPPCRMPSPLPPLPHLSLARTHSRRSGCTSTRSRASSGCRTIGRSSASPCCSTQTRRRRWSSTSSPS
jgi:hypothetical protein